MGIKKSDRLKFKLSFELQKIIAEKEFIEKDFANSFFVSDTFPKIKIEHRSNEVPAFIGFSIYGNGSTITLNDSVEVEFEILLNIPQSENSYSQISIQMLVIDKRYKSDYVGYY